MTTQELRGLLLAVLAFLAAATFVARRRRSDLPLWPLATDELWPAITALFAGFALGRLLPALVLDVRAPSGATWRVLDSTNPCYLGALALLACGLARRRWPRLDWFHLAPPLGLVGLLSDPGGFARLLLADPLGLRSVEDLALVALLAVPLAGLALADDVELRRVAPEVSPLPPLASTLALMGFLAVTGLGSGTLCLAAVGSLSPGSDGDGGRDRLVPALVAAVFFLVLAAFRLGLFWNGLLAAAVAGLLMAATRW